MSDSPTRARRQERNRAAILDAARELLLERGLDGFSLREVARRADYAPGALYTYFANVDELLGALGMAALRVLGEYLDAVPTTLPAEERAVALAEAYLRFAAERPEEYAIAFDRLTVPATRWAAFTQVAWPFTILVEAFAAGVASGEFVARPGFGAAEMAYGAWALANGAVALDRRHLASIDEDLTPMKLEAVRAYVRGLGRKE